MPLLDVSKVLSDPRFMDSSLVVYRMEQAVGENGRAMNKEHTLGFSGVVTTNNGFTLQRNPDGSMVSGAINIYTRYRLTSGRYGRDADEICWRGKRYTVVSVDDNAHFGRGFIHAVCQLKSLSGTN